jgi:hypothetical protein
MKYKVSSGGTFSIFVDSGEYDISNSYLYDNSTSTIIFNISGYISPSHVDKCDINTYPLLTFSSRFGGAYAFLFGSNSTASCSFLSFFIYPNSDIGTWIIGCFNLYFLF